MPNIIYDAIKAALPEGTAWGFENDSDTDKYFEGKSENFETVRIFLENLSNIRNPELTILLSDLEKEYGILTDNRISESTRRMQLATRIFKKLVVGYDYLQEQLQNAGFTEAQVHTNDPAVDPAIFLDQSFQMVAGGFNAYAGRDDAFAGRVGGELLVNGAILSSIPDYLTVAGDSYSGNNNAVAGYFEDFKTIEFEYNIPTNPNQWPFVFFVGGDATRNVSGELTDIQQIIIPAERENEFKNIITRFKPLHAWGALILSFG